MIIIITTTLSGFETKLVHTCASVSRKLKHTVHVLKEEKHSFVVFAFGYFFFFFFWIDIRMYVCVR